MSLRIVLTVTIFGVLFLATDNRSLSVAQTVSDTGVQKKIVLPPKVVVRGDGWELPFIQKPSKTSQKIVKLGETLVTRTYLIPNSEIFKFEEFTTQGDENLWIGKIDCRVGGVFAFSIKDRIFAYQTVFNPVSVTDGNVTPTAGVIPIQFIDRDGDGKFETRIRTTSEPEIPSWVVTP